MKVTVKEYQMVNSAIEDEIATNPFSFWTEWSRKLFKKSSFLSMIAALMFFVFVGIGMFNLVMNDTESFLTNMFLSFSLFVTMFLMIMMGIIGNRARKRNIELNPFKSKREIIEVTWSPWLPEGMVETYSSRNQKKVCNCTGILSFDFNFKWRDEQKNGLALLLRGVEDYKSSFSYNTSISLADHLKHIELLPESGQFKLYYNGYDGKSGCITLKPVNEKASPKLVKQMRLLTKRAKKIGMEITVSNNF